MGLKLGRYFTAENFDEWLDSVANLKNVLVNNGYEVPSDINDILDFWVTVSWDDFLIGNIAPPNREAENSGFLGVFNTVEYLIESIDRIYSWLNPHAQVAHSFKKKNGMLYPYIERWFNWAEYNRKILAKEERMRQYLYTTESSGLEQLFDVNGEPVITQEGYFEGGNT